MGGSTSSETPKGRTPRRGDSSQSAASLDDVEERVGRMGVAARYHKARLIQDDYNVDVRKVLGTGCNGDVHLASNKSTALKYAVKTFKLAGLSKDKREALESEVAVFLALDNPHVCRLYDVYETKDQMHLVMECMEGGELFDRITEIKRFSERDAANAVHQMLLAVNYLHSHDIVHRDLKLENFLYDKKGSQYLKLIDFGFSKVISDPNIKMHVSCGTLSYVAPEVLEKDYTSQCDLWSLGVICFILLSGYMPFSGDDRTQIANIKAGKYKIKPDRWKSISKAAQDFTFTLLQVDPRRRLTAEAALAHPFVNQRHAQPEAVDPGVVSALREFGQASKFRRCCMNMMAWSLTNEERSKVRDCFLALDKNKQGTITLAELRDVMVNKFQIDDAETLRIFATMDSNNDEEIHYSDFLAAMVSTRIQMNDNMLQNAFKRFDKDNSGYITVDNLREVLGDTFEGMEVSQLLNEADFLGDQRISYAEFVAFLRGERLGKNSRLRFWRNRPPSSSSVSRESLSARRLACANGCFDGFRRPSDRSINSQ